ncbi:bifunctional folylpolyglutamate synthase/dihydrofolate synthase [Candidatus Protochlamydia phocaeensis]|uniref:bifunctional folylpolyglutamate synthase/dihydrofolate synthase n=1 Tax=Candidatus Protochlamydia phocaeensis TaxID=1414722 RepID=UPI000837C42F|nr:folylpolyglutamate synthase/dihydrofolate synthase family protein [Candidatus Protochlamydia phocaeensis]
MTYSQLIQRLFQINLFGGAKLELQNCFKLQKLLNYPDRSFHTIHVAGTNGKGSVVTKIAAGLEHAGYRVGLYTSPHLSCFRERIRINKQMIPEEAIEELLPYLFNLAEAEQIPATFFELTTFLALLYFAREKVDFAVLETGLGGRLDATNIVSPLLSVITSISLDHTDILGPSIESIAKEKAGIIKPSTPVVIGPRVPHSQIQLIAEQLQSPCIAVKEGSSFFEEENRLIARASLQQLSSHFPLSSESIAKGLEAKQPCRFERVPGPHPIILDVAHNPDGLIHLFDAMHQHFPNRPIRVLFGLSKNKDLSRCLDILHSHAHHFHLVEAPNGRGVSCNQLKAELQALKVDNSRLSIHPSIAEGTVKAKEEAAAHGQALVVCGSFFIMSHVRQALGFVEPCDFIDLNERCLPSRLA